MKEIIVFIFSVLIASFVINKYFSYIKIDESIKYDGNGNSELNCFLAFFAYVLFFLGVIILNKIIIIVGIVFLGGSLFNEARITICKINFYDKKFKELLKRDSIIDKQKLKKDIVKDAIKNNFYLLSLPLIVLEKGINKVLNSIFK